MRWARSAWAIGALAVNSSVASCALFVDFDQNPATGGGGATASGGGGSSTGAGGAGEGGMGGKPDCGEWCRGTVCKVEADCDGGACLDGVCQATKVAESTEGKIQTLGADDGTVAFITAGASASSPIDGKLCLSHPENPDASTECPDVSGACPCHQLEGRWDERGTHVAVHDGRAFYSPQCPDLQSCTPQASVTPVLSCKDDGCGLFPSALQGAVDKVNGLAVLNGQLIALDDATDSVVVANATGSDSSFFGAMTVSTGQLGYVDLHSVAFSGSRPSDPIYISSFGDPHPACIATTSVTELMNGEVEMIGCATTAGLILNVVTAGPDMGLGLAHFDPGSGQTSFIHVPHSDDINVGTKPIVATSILGGVPYMAARGGFYYVWENGAVQRCPAMGQHQECRPVTPGGLVPGPIAVTGRYVYIASSMNLYRARR